MTKRESIPHLYNTLTPEAKLHLDSPHTYYGEPVASPITTDIHAQCQEAQFEEKYYYINNTYRDVTLMKRDGLCMTIGHTNSLSSRDFIIRRMIRLKSRALLSTVAALAQLTSVESSELAEIKKCLNNIDSGKYSEASLMLDYEITTDELRAKGNTVYHQQTDVVLSLNDILRIDPHPFSARFLNIGAFGQTQEYAQQKELNLKIRLVDHSNVATPRYLNFGGKIFKLMPQKDAPYRRIQTTAQGKVVDKNYGDYVQVFFSASNDTSVVDNEGVGCIKMTLAEARDNMGLCDNIHDATNPGRVDAERKRELGLATHNLELLKGENARERAQFEKEDMARKENLAHQLHELELTKMNTAKQRQELEALQAAAQLEIAAAKHAQSQLDADLLRLDNERKAIDLQKKLQDESLERDRREFEEKAKRIREDQEARIKNESLYWKEFYEMRALQRKDTSEFVKFIPGLVLGISGIAAAYLKFGGSVKAA